MAGPLIIRIVGLAGQIITKDGDNPVGQLIVSYDPEAHDGQGESIGTLDISLAKQFPSMEAVMEFIMQQPKARPLRDDGKPNRPLRAYSLEVIEMEIHQ